MTRGLVGFCVNGNYIAKRVHSDAHPSALGAETLTIIREFAETTPHWQDTMKQILQSLELVDELGDMPFDVQEQYEFGPGDWFLNGVLSGRLKQIYNQIDFINCSDFCEYAYIINVDSGKLEFYIGFQHGPQEGNPFGEEKTKYECYPCKLALCIWFDEILEADSFDDILRHMKMRGIFYGRTQYGWYPGA